MRNGLAVIVFLAVVALLATGMVSALSDRLAIERAKVEAQASVAAAERAEAEAALTVAQAQARILNEAARSVAADRRLVTLYAVSGNAAVIIAVAFVGVGVGFIAGRRTRHDD